MNTTAAATLPAIPAEATALAVDRWQYNVETIVAVYDRTGREEQDCIWGEFLGLVTLSEDATEDDALAALRAAGWTEGDPLPYCRPGTSGTVTAWTR